MTTAERMQGFFDGVMIDRVPVFSSATMFSGRRCGLTSGEFYFDIPKLYQAQKQVITEFGFDDSPCYDVPNGETLDFGGVVDFSENEPVKLPHVTHFPINSIEDLISYRLPPIEKRLYTQKMVEYYKYAISMGDEDVTVSGGTPFNLIGYMVNPEIFLRWLRREPGAIDELLNISMSYLTETADYLIDIFGVWRCSGFAYTPFHTNELVSAETVNKYSIPWLVKIRNVLKEKGIESFGIHICGRQNSNLDLYKACELPTDSFISVDEQTDIALAADVLGHDKVYAGNIPSSLLVCGTEKEVYDASVELIRNMRGNEGGFILMPSCDLPVNTKPENLKAVLRAAEDSGEYRRTIWDEKE